MQLKLSQDEFKVFKHLLENKLQHFEKLGLGELEKIAFFVLSEFCDRLANIQNNKKYSIKLKKSEHQLLKLFFADIDLKDYLTNPFVYQVLYNLKKYLG